MHPARQSEGPGNLSVRGDQNRLAPDIHVRGGRFSWTKGGGKHDGIERFTVGQRKGLGVALGTPRFVVRIEADTRRVVIATKDELAARELIARQANYLAEIPPGPRPCAAQIRYRSPPVPATMHVLANAQLRIVFDQPCDAVAPGQAVACYDGPRLLGGGWIDSWTAVTATAENGHPL